MADAMVYPMAFSARHSVELGLKMSIKELMEIYSKPKIKTRVTIDEVEIQKGLRSHNIEILTAILTGLLPIDSRLHEYSNVLLSYLSDYYFDDRGDMFRYAETVDGGQNLQNKHIEQVGLTHLCKRFIYLVNSDIGIIRGL